jgi:hypothetical protein
MSKDKKKRRRLVGQVAIRNLKFMDENAFM